jgi:hypothetical protein
MKNFYKMTVCQIAVAEFLENLKTAPVSDWEVEQHADGTASAIKRETDMIARISTDRPGREAVSLNSLLDR